MRTFVLDVGDATQGIVGVDVKHHERLKAETPKAGEPAAVSRGRPAVRAFAPRATTAIEGKTELAVMWLEHLLLSMLQHASGRWRWGRSAGGCDAAGT